MPRVSEILICLKVHLSFFAFFAILDEPVWRLSLVGACHGRARPATRLPPV